MATVSTSQNLSAVSYSAGEDITIDSGAVLTVDSTPAVNPGSIICITYGELHVDNSSLSSMVVLTLSANSKDYRFEKNGVFRITGDMIELDPGTGATQIWDFTVSPLDAVPYPSYVEVETAPGSGIYRERFVVCTAGCLAPTAVTTFGAGNVHGDVLFWDASTRELFSGDDVNGNSIPSGCKVRVPNAWIHSATGNATATSRTLVDLSPTGRLFASCVGFSPNIWANNTTAPGAIDLYKVGFVGTCGIQNGTAPLTLENVVIQADPDYTVNVANGAVIANILGESRISGLSVMASNTITANNAIILYLNTLLDCTLCENLVGMYRGARGSTSLAAVELLKVTAPSIDNMYAIGGRIELTDMSDVRLLNCGHTNISQDVASTVTAQHAIVIVRSKNVAIVNFTNCGTDGARLGLVNAGNTQNENIRFFGGSYDFNNNFVNSTAGLMVTGSGKGLELYNFSFTNFTGSTSNRVSDSPTTFLSSFTSFYNVRSTSLTGIATNEGVCSGYYDGVPGSPNDFQAGFAGGVDFTGAHLLDSTTLTPTTSSIYFGCFGDSDRIALAGGAQLGQNGFIELPEDGDTVEIVSQTYHGITAFQNADPIWRYVDGGVTVTNTAVAPPTMAVDFAVAVGDSGAFGSYSTLNATNLAAAVAALVDYSSDGGLRVRIRVTTSGTSSTRNFIAVHWACDFDSSYLAPDAFVTVRGADDTDVTTMYLFSDDTELAAHTGSGVFRFVASTYYEEDVYFVRRNSGGIEIMRTRNNPQPLLLGDNGYLDVFAGVEVQLAESPSVTTILALVQSYLDVAVSSRLADADYTPGGGGGLDAAGVRAAIGLASANLDDQLDALPTAAENADGVWDEARADHTTAGTFGAVSEWSGAGSLDAAGVRAAIGLASANLDAQLGDLPTNSELASELGGLNDVTASEVADAVWDEARSGHTTAGSFGAVSEWASTSLDAAGVRAAVGLASADLDAQLADIPSDVRTELTTELSRIDATVSSRLPTAGYTAPLTEATTRSALGLASANLDTQLGDLPTNAELASSLAGLNDPSAAVIADAVWDEARSGHATAGSFGAVSEWAAPAGLDAAGVRAAIGLASANLDTQLGDIPSDVRTELTTELSRIDATVSSRLATAGYTAPLTEASTRSALGLASANLDTQLGDIPTNSELASGLSGLNDASASEVADAVWDEARSGHTTAGSFGAVSEWAAPSGLDAAGVRAAIGLASADLDAQLAGLPADTRTELSVELARLDVDVSSRLSTAGYTAPLDSTDTQAAAQAAIDASSLATQASITALNDISALDVRTELTTELARIDVPVSTRLATAGYTAPLTAASTRSAIGLASANLDTQLGDIPTNAELASELTGLNDPSAAAIADAVWDEARAAHTTAGSFGAVSEWSGVGSLDAAGVRAAIGLASANLDAQIADLPTNAELASSLGALNDISAADVRTELTTELARLDANVSSRLATAGYTEAPDSVAIQAAAEAAIVAQSPLEANIVQVGGGAVASVADLKADVSGLATQASVDALPADVRAELTTELDRIDVAVSTRLATSGYSAPLDAAGTRSAVGLAAANLDTQLTGVATQASVDALPADVRTELTTELGRIDVAVSTRLATSGYSDPLDAAGTRSAVGLAAANLDTQLAGLAGQATAIDASIAALNDPSPAEIADAVWDETRSGHATVGTYGAVSEWAGSAGLDAAGVRAAVGLASANLDSQLADLPTNAELTSALGSLNDISASDVRAAIGLASANLDTQLDTLNSNVDAVVGYTADTNQYLYDSIDPALVNLDASVSSRLASAAYTTAPDASAVQAAAEAALVAQSPLDVNIVQVGGGAVVSAADLKADVSGLATQASVNALQDLSAADIRAELAAELALIDASISSRLPTASYTAPLTASETRAALGMAAADLDAQLADLPTGAELSAALGALNDPSAAQVAGAVWGEARSAHTTAGTFGAVAEWASAGGLDAAGIRAAVGLSAADLDTQLEAIPTLAELNAAIDDLNDISAADVRTELSVELARIDVAVSTRLAASAYTVAPDSAEIEAAVTAAITAYDVAQASDLVGIDAAVWAYPTRSLTVDPGAAGHEATLEAIADISALLGAGSGMETVTLTLVDTSNGDVPVPDALINVYDATGTVLVTYARTDASGEVTLFIDSGNYILRVFKPGVASLQQALAVADTGGLTGQAFQIDAEAVLVAPPASPALCRLYADFVTQDGAPLFQFKVRVANKYDPTTSAGLSVVESVRDYITDQAGHLEFDVVRGTRIQVALITTPWVREFVVPDRPVESLLTVFGAATDAFQIVPTR